jgi:hypothetical protein
MKSLLSSLSFYLVDDAVPRTCYPSGVTLGEAVVDEVSSLFSLPLL